MTPLELDINPELPFFDGDVPKEFLRAAQLQGAVAWDIETSGLDWKSERIGLCQLLVKEHGLAVVKIKRSARPNNLLALLQDSSVRKIFHHAMFDLRFMAYHWAAFPVNIACTKIAAKLIDPDVVTGHTLEGLVHTYLGIKLDKSSRRTDWLTWQLSPDQLRYAGDDVKYLGELLNALSAELEKRGRLILANQCFSHIPTQVQLDIQGFRDTYGY